MIQWFLFDVTTRSLKFVWKVNLTINVLAKSQKCFRENFNFFEEWVVKACCQVYSAKKREKERNLKLFLVPVRYSYDQNPEFLIPRHTQIPGNSIEQNLITLCIQTQKRYKKIQKIIQKSWALNQTWACSVKIW